MLQERDGAREGGAARRLVPHQAHKGLQEPRRNLICEQMRQKPLMRAPWRPMPRLPKERDGAPRAVVHLVQEGLQPALPRLHEDPGMPQAAEVPLRLQRLRSRQTLSPQPLLLRAIGRVEGGGESEERAEEGRQARRVRLSQAVGAPHPSHKREKAVPVADFPLPQGGDRLLLPDSAEVYRPPAHPRHKEHRPDEEGQVSQELQEEEERADQRGVARREDLRRFRLLHHGVQARGRGRDGHRRLGGRRHKVPIDALVPQIKLHDGLPPRLKGELGGVEGLRRPQEAPRNGAFQEDIRLRPHRQRLGVLRRRGDRVRPLHRGEALPALLLRPREIGAEGQNREEPRRIEEGVPKGNGIRRLHPKAGEPRPLPRQLGAEGDPERELPREDMQDLAR